ncbi:hypothetical protein ALC60_01691, partial [Trachymyrmex zeteki]
EGVKGRLDSVSQVCAQRRTPESRTYLLLLWNMASRRDPMKPVSFEQCEHRSYFRIKELNPFYLDLFTQDWTTCELKNASGNTGYEEF